jgi:hypothetical protein
MTETRKIRRVWRSKPTMEGAGVHLRRALGYSEVPMFDPFLLLDDFRSSKPAEYIKGFPWRTANNRAMKILWPALLICPSGGAIVLCCRQGESESPLWIDRH